MTLLDLTTEAEDVVGFQPALRAAAWMAAFPGKWAIAGGWALDLFLGQVTREHDDVEVAIFRDDQRGLRDYLYLNGWSFEAQVGPARGDRERWDGRQWLEPPVHEIHATSPDGDEHLEILLNERRGRQWRYRRSAAVSLPIDRAIRRGAWNVPVLAPEVVLLYKSKDPRAKDRLDFRAVVERLDEEALAWLRGAVLRAHPSSEFLKELREGLRV
jgi:hypothetical protein